MNHHHQLELDPELTLLEVPSPRSTVLHRLVCQQLADAAAMSEPRGFGSGSRSGSGSPSTSSSSSPSAYWVDARNAAATHALYDCAPSRHTLDGLQIARAFTAYQHHSLVRNVTRRADPETALIVAPNVGSLYRDADLPAHEREDLRAASLETLSELGRVLECPVLVTSAESEDAGVIDEYAETTIECVRTREGIRLESDSAGDESVMTPGYWHETYWQTTIPYWVDVCGAIDERGQDPVVAAHDQGLLEMEVSA